MSGHGGVGNRLLLLNSAHTDEQKKYITALERHETVKPGMGGMLPAGPFGKIVYFFPKEGYGGELNRKLKVLVKYRQTLTGVNSMGVERRIGLSTVLGEAAAKLYGSARKAVHSIYWLCILVVLLPARRGRLRSRAAHGMINVLHLACSGHLSGVTVVMMNALSALDRKRFEPSVCFIERGGVMADRMKALGYDVTVIGKRHYDIATIKELKALMEEKGTDILHAHGFKHSVYGRVAAAIAGVPVIIAHFHGGVKGGWKKLEPFGRVSLKITDKVVSLTGIMKEEMVSCWYGYRASTEKIVIIPNSVDTETFRPVADKAAAKRRLGLKDGVTAVGIVARLSPGKGHEVLFDAIAKLEAQGHRLQCLIVGRGPHEAVLMERTKELGIAENVVFMGERHDVAEILPALDIHVQPSVWSGESFSLSTVEAMSCGVPVIASRVGGLAEVVDDGLTGLLFEPGDAGGLATAVKRLLDEPEMAERLGAKAREKVVKSYSRTVFVNNIRNLYDGLLNKPRSVVSGKNWQEKSRP